MASAKQKKWRKARKKWNSLNYQFEEHTGQSLKRKALEQLSKVYYLRLIILKSYYQEHGLGIINKSKII